MRTLKHLKIFGALSILSLLNPSCSENARFYGNSNRNKPILKEIDRQGDAILSQKSTVPSEIAVRPSDLSLALQYRDTSDPLKLVLIVDDSPSMVPKQQALAAGLDLALDTVKGKNVSVYLYSSSIFGRGYKFFDTNYLNNYRLTQFPLPAPVGEKIYASWGGMHDADILSGTAKPSLEVMARLKKNGVWFEPGSSLIDFVPEEAETKFVINRSAFISADGALQFTDTMTPEEFAAMKSKLKKELIIGDNGNPEEMPLCTLAALLQNDGPNKIFGNKDRAAFVIISDEDQTKKLKPCPNAHKVTSVAVNPSASAVALARTAKVIMDYQTKCDSTANDGYCGSQPWLQRFHTSCKTNPLCEITTGKYQSWEPCSAAQRADYLEYFRKTYATELASGKYRLSDTDKCQAVLAPGFQGVVQSQVSVSWDNPDPRPFVLAGKTYASIPAYFESLFPNESFDGTVKTFGQFGSPTGGFVNIEGVASAEDLPQVLRKKAIDLFGQGNFTISVIGNTGNSGNAGAAGCSIDPAAESKILFNAADTKASVCDPDYSKGLSWLEGFGFKRLVPSYKIAPEYLTDQYILSIASNGNESLLMPDQYSYDTATETLTLKITVPYSKDGQIIVRRK